MKIRGLCLIVAAFISVTARGDLTIVQKIEGSGSLKQITMKLKGDKARVEVSPELTTIMETKGGDILTLMNTKKKFVRISAEKSRAIADLASKYGKNSSAPAEKSKLVCTGRKETINDYETVEYVRESSSMKESYWIALTYPYADEIVKQLQAIAPTAWNEIAKGMLDFSDFPGLPLRTIIKTNGKEVVSTIISIKQDLLSDMEFSVPRDFEELKVPNLQDVLSEKKPAPPSTKP